MIAMTWPQYLRRECSYKGWRTRLSRLEADLMLILLLRGGQPTPAALLTDAVYGDDPDGGPNAADDRIREIIRCLRRKLPDAIRGRHGFGYFI